MFRVCLYIFSAANARVLASGVLHSGRCVHAGRSRLLRDWVGRDTAVGTTAPTTRHTTQSKGPSPGTSDKGT